MRYKFIIKSLVLSFLLIQGFCVLNFTSSSQNLPLDTIELKGEYIVLYENNIWAYTISPEEHKREVALTEGMDLFRNYWNNDITFACSYPDPGPIPDTITLVLTDVKRKFVMPYYGRINSGFGWRSGRKHNGLDIDLERGAPVKSAFDGKIRYAKFNDGGYGNLVIIRHFNGLETYYSHLNEINVKPNEIVKAGQIIGTGGNSGARWTGEHLHFEMRWMDHPFDPLKIIEYDSLRLFSDTLILTKADFVMKQSHKAYLSYINGQAVANNAKTSPAPASTASASSNTRASYRVHPSEVPNYHIVKKGDTLSGIAYRYGTSVDALCRKNGLTKTSVLQIGQKIKIK
jgi:murein DD-endopeptidase MepM/ murein hydrolase activator NlpD